MKGVAAEVPMKRARLLTCFCGGERKINEIVKAGGDGRYYVKATCTACETSIECRNWPLAKYIAKILERMEKKR